ncbi:MAG: hypothetical protein AAF937_03625 [Planctomycetota bacterium]
MVSRVVAVMMVLLCCVGCSQRRAIAVNEFAAESANTLRAAATMEERILLAELPAENQKQALATTRMIRNSVKDVDEIIDALASTDFDPENVVRLESSFRTMYRHMQATLEQPPAVFATRGFDAEEFKQWESQLDAMLQAAKSLR